MPEDDLKDLPLITRRLKMLCREHEIDPNELKAKAKSFTRNNEVIEQAFTNREKIKKPILSQISKAIHELIDPNFQENWLTIESDLEFYWLISHTKIKVKYSHDEEALASGMYIVYRRCSYNNTKFTSGILFIENNQGSLDSRIIYKYHDDKVGEYSESKGFWYANTGGSVVLTSHPSHTQEGKRRTRIIMIGDEVQGAMRQFRFGIILSTSVAEIRNPVAQKCVLELIDSTESEEELKEKYCIRFDTIDEFCEYYKLNGSRIARIINSQHHESPDTLQLETNNCNNIMFE